MEYDRQTRLLARKQTVRGRNTILGDYRYTHDITGRLIQVVNKAQKSDFFHNDVIDASSEYQYDAIGRLVAASGHQQVGSASDGGRRLVAPSTAATKSHVGLGDGSQIYKYLETYVYDDAGNILSMRHEGVDNAPISGWAMQYVYAEPSLIQPGVMSNRPSQTSVGDASEEYRYDGNSADSG